MQSQCWRERSYLIKRQEFGPSDDKVGIEALLDQESFDNEVGNVISGNETDLAVLRRAYDLVVGPDAIDME